jgi:hypothetical protein
MVRLRENPLLLKCRHQGDPIMPKCLKVSRMKPFRLPVIASLVIVGLTAATTMAQAWTKVSPAPTSEGLTGVVYAKSLFVAVGDSGAILTSPDGFTWTSRTSGVKKMLYAVSANATVFVAVGEGGTILTSTNGTSWTSRTSKTTSDLHGVAWSGTTFVAAGYTSAVVTSTDGTSWTSRTLGTDTDLNGVAWGNGKFVAAGFDGMNGTVNTSPNGTTWTSQTIDAPNGLLSVAWCGNAFIAGSLGLVVSSDGTAWTTYSPGLSNFIFCTAGNSSRMVAVGAMGTILSSSDDTTWTEENSGDTASLNCVAWGDNMFIAVGEAGTILTSLLTNGILYRRTAANGRGPAITVGNHSVHFSLFADAAVTLRLYSSQGRLVRSMNALMHEGEHAAPSTFISGLAQGRYLLSFKAGNYTIDRPVLVVK